LRQNDIFYVERKTDYCTFTVLRLLY